LTQPAESFTLGNQRVSLEPALAESNFVASAGRRAPLEEEPRVSDLAALRRLTHTPLFGSLLHLKAPLLDLPGATTEELENWQRRFDRDLHACGCTSGAVTLIGSLAILGLLEFAFGLNIGSGFTRVGIWIGVTLAAATGGKAAGLFVAKVRRHRLHEEIAETLASRQRIDVELAST
jgi:hypothetical protein